MSHMNSPQTSALARRPGSNPSYQRTCLLLGMTIATCLSGCATSREFSVYAMAVPAASTGQQTYRLVNATEGIYDNAVSFKQVASDLRVALSHRGMLEAPPDGRPSITIRVDYGLGPPRIEFVPQTQKHYLVITPEPSDLKPEFQEFLETETAPIFVPKTVYTRFLRLTATTFSDVDAPRQLWFVEVKSDGERADLTGNLRWMTAAATEYIGTNASKTYSVYLEAD